MIYLRSQDIDIDTALKQHADYFYSVAIRKLDLRFELSKSKYGKEEFYESCRKIQHPFKSSKFEDLKNWLLDQDRIETIIASEPIELFALNETFKSFVDQTFGCGTYTTYITPKDKRTSILSVEIEKFFENISDIFNYDFLGEKKNYTSYTLTRNLGIRTCVYCNRIYTLTQTREGYTGENDGGRLMNPQLDHYFPKSKYPLLQVSFFNLIPSCDICNSRVKKAFEFDINVHSHPYQKQIPELFFSYRPRYMPGDKNYHVFFVSDENQENKKAKLTAEAMQTDRIYEAHQYELVDLIKLKKAYSNKYLESLQHFFPETDFEDVYRLIIGTEMLPKNYHKRPFSKFKADILKELRNDD